MQGAPAVRWHGTRNSGNSSPGQSPHLHPLSPQTNSSISKHTFTITLHQNRATEYGMCPVHPYPLWHTASILFLDCDHCDGWYAFFLPLTPQPKGSQAEKMIIWLLMQFCNDRDHNQSSFDYSLLKMRKRLLFTASPCHCHSYNFPALPLEWCTTSTFPAQLCPIRGVIVPSAGVVPPVAGKQLITHAACLLHSGTRLVRTAPPRTPRCRIRTMMQDN